MMVKSSNQAEEVKALVRAKGVLRPRDLEAKGIPRTVLSRLCEAGELTRTGRGLYVAAIEDFTENHSLAEVSKLVPKGVVCLLSALRFHQLTTQLPSEVWLAIPSKARRPKGGTVTIRPIYFSGDALTLGIEIHTIENVSVKVYSPAKTVADCFKSRNKIGLDVAIEALRDCWRKKKATADDLWRYAKICRVSKVMQPYMESIV
jgi:predicted transcriptional regulator of viral defense system